MAMGGTIAAIDKRYRLLRRRKIEKSRKRSCAILPQHNKYHEST